MNTTNFIPAFAFESVGHFFSHYRLPRGNKLSDEWRLVPDAPLGEIDGLPTSRGCCVATNGILCYIQRSDDTLFLGHFQHFVPDEVEKEKKPRLVGVEKESTLDWLWQAIGSGI